MPITPTNLSKNTITPSTSNKGGYALWSDTDISWDDSMLFWDSPIQFFGTNLSKNSITPNNLNKN